MSDFFNLKLITVETQEEIKAKFLYVNDLSGSLGIYPDHIDYITALSRGLGYFIDTDSNKVLIAYDYGILKVKNNNISLITRTFLKGKDYSQLMEELNKKIQKIEEFEKQLRENLKTLERMIMKEVVEVERG